MFVCFIRQMYIKLQNPIDNVFKTSLKTMQIHFSREKMKKLRLFIIATFLELVFLKENISGLNVCSGTKIHKNITLNCAFLNCRITLNGFLNVLSFFCLFLSFKIKIVLEGENGFCHTDTYKTIIFLFVKTFCDAKIYGGMIFFVCYIKNPFWL